MGAEKHRSKRCWGGKEGIGRLVRRVRLVKGSEEIRFTGSRGVSEDKMHFQLLFEDRQRGDRP